LNRVPVLALLALLPFSAAWAQSPIAPFKAEYETLRNGKALARTVIEWKENADATWTLRTTTQGTSGLAKMAGLDVTEESIVRWVDGRPETTQYDFDQDVAFKSRKRHGEFDHETNTVHMVEGKSDARYALVPYAIDRHALTLALAADLSRGSDRFEYKVAMKDAIEDIRYTRCGDAELNVPAGRFATNCLERVREKRTSKCWFEPGNGWVPVQIEQVERKGDTITLRLTSIER
jgi:hypothetical protein